LKKEHALILVIIGIAVGWFLLNRTARASASATQQRIQDISAEENLSARYGRFIAV